VTTIEAAARLGISQQRIRLLISGGTLRATKEGRDWRITEKDLKVFEAAKRGVGRPAGKGDK